MGSEGHGHVGVMRNCSKLRAVQIAPAGDDPRSMWTPHLGSGVDGRVADLRGVDFPVPPENPPKAGYLLECMKSIPIRNIAIHFWVGRRVAHMASSASP